MFVNLFVLYIFKFGGYLNFNINPVFMRLKRVRKYIVQRDFVLQC